MCPHEPDHERDREGQQPTDHLSFQNVSFTYQGEEGLADVRALDDVSFTARPGEFIVVLGHNASGKSTLAKHVNALFVPDEGRVCVCGNATDDRAHVYDIRQHAGMVFQNPDSQMVTSIVIDDVAFGPENLGLPPDEIRERALEALEKVNMTDHVFTDPSELSGGQRQRIAIAGILAMRPDIMILDEPGAMLDPRGRRGVRRVCKELHEQGLTILLITHFMEEALLADRVIVMNEGAILFDDTPQEVFSHGEELQRIGLDLPFPLKLSQALRDRGMDIEDTLDVHELRDRIGQQISAQAGNRRDKQSDEHRGEKTQAGGEELCP